MQREKGTEKLLEEIMTKNGSGYADIRKKQTLKQKILLEIETFYNDKRGNPLKRYNQYKHIYCLITKYIKKKLTEIEKEVDSHTAIVGGFLSHFQ